jgi:hypothetical protein
MEPTPNPQFSLALTHGMLEARRMTGTMNNVDETDDDSLSGHNHLA